jgi:uncharacterized membrane protein YedE/YeeE
MHDFGPYSALIGGAIIGLAASLFLLAHGRICGISGTFGGLLRRGSDSPLLRIAFVSGLLMGGAALRFAYPAAFASGWTPSLLLAIPAGVLVGFGTRLGNGCTSGHGICGISRLSPRSLIATGTFMRTGFATVFVMRHVLGGGQYSWRPPRPSRPSSPRSEAVPMPGETLR